MGYVFANFADCQALPSDRLARGAQNYTYLVFVRFKLSGASRLGEQILCYPPRESEKGNIETAVVKTTSSKKEKRRKERGKEEKMKGRSERGREKKSYHDKWWKRREKGDIF